MTKNHTPEDVLNITTLAAHAHREAMDIYDGDLEGNCMILTMALRQVLLSVQQDAQRITGHCNSSSHEWIMYRGLHVDCSAGPLGGPEVIVTDELPGVYDEWTSEEWDADLLEEWQTEVSDLAAQIVASLAESDSRIFS